MGYRFRDGEAFPDGVRRIAFEQIDKALDRLRPTVRNKDEAIHDARVCIKKTRALLRLVRDLLGDEIYEAENTAYRDAGRKLSAVRDSAAMIEIIDKLTERFSEQLSADAFGRLRGPLVCSKRGRQQDQKRAMAEVAKTLRVARRRVEEWPVKRNDALALSRGLRRVFKRGRTEFAAAYDQPSIENFHEWRKQVKHLLYQVRLLKPVWPKLMEGWADELKKLGGYLSDDHDLAILREKVLEQSARSSKRIELEALVALVDQRRGELQVKARGLGARIYAEKPGAFVDRAQAYWQAWRSEVEADPIAVS